MKRALVTGATGMLGSYVVERLVAEGWSVRALVRDPSRAGPVKALGADVVPGDVTRLEAMRAAAAGCDAIFHAAAVIGSGSDGEAFRLGNVVGAEHAVSAAEAAGSRLVHVSSIAVFGRHRYGAAATDENAALPSLPARDAYGRSKQEAERAVLGAHAARRVWATVVRPPVMYGKRDRQFAPRVGPLLQRGLFPLVAGGRTTLPLVHASAVADGAIRAAAADVAGGRVYHLTDDFLVTAADLVRYAALGLGRRIRAPRIPIAAARLAFRALGIGLILRGRPDLARHASGLLEMLSRDNPFRSARARRELGWSPTVRPSEGLPEAFRWWSDHRRSDADSPSAVIRGGPGAPS
jgi:nucleoside-diphosphate-sugar epimerase